MHKNNTHRRPRFHQPLLLGLALLPHVALADTAPGVRTMSLEEVFVTARKLTENSQDVPLSLRVFDAETLRREGIQDLSDLGLMVPGMTFDIGGFVQDTRPAIRGMQNERGRPSLAVMIDYVDASSENLSLAGGGSALHSRLLDVERIEVVKGPQTLLYGRNAFGGAINIVTQRPSDTWQGRLGSEIANGGRRTVEAGLSGPLLEDRLSMRASLVRNDFDGFYRNPATGARLGTEESTAGSLALLFTPNERLDVYGRFQYSDESYSEPAIALATWNERLPVPGGSFSAGPPGSPMLPCPGDLSGQPAAVFNACTRGTLSGRLDARERDIDLSPDPSTGEAFPGMNQIQRFGSLQADYAIGESTLTYLAGYLRNNSFDRSDADYTNFGVDNPMAFATSTINELGFRFRQITQELRFAGSSGSWQWVAGAAGYWEQARLDNSSQFWMRNPNSLLGGPPFNLATAPNPGAKPNNPQSRDTDHYSLFASVGYDLNDQWTVTAAARMSWDYIDYTVPTWSRQQISLQQQIPVPICPPELDDRDVPDALRYPNVAFDCSVSDSVNSRILTPRALVEYRPSETVLLFASATRGFKPGGFSANEAVTLEGQRYKAETVTTWELGGKSEWMQRRLRMNGALYFNDYRDQQIGIQQRVAGSMTEIPGITNAARVHVYGLEVDALFAATEHLQLMLAYAYTHATFERFVQGQERSSPLNRAEAGNIDADFSGNWVGKSPRHAWNLSADYRRPLPAAGLDWFAGASVIWRSKRYLDEANLVHLPAFTRVNLRAGVSSERYQLQAFVDNLLDDRKILMGQRVVDLGNPDGFAPGRAYLLHLPQPRSVGLRLSAAF